MMGFEKYNETVSHCLSLQEIQSPEGLSMSKDEKQEQIIFPVVFVSRFCQKDYLQRYDQSKETTWDAEVPRD